MIISHILPPSREGEEWKIQTNEEHQQGVAKLADRFAEGFPLGEVVKIAGELHDKGKELKGFQQYIKKASGYQPELSARKTPHAESGALLAWQVYASNNQLVGFIASELILGHHAGLKDESEVRCKLKDGKLSAEIDQNVEAQPVSLNKYLASLGSHPGDMHHVTRMLYSCLVDADYLDTESFMDTSHAALRNKKRTLEELAPLLDDYLKKLKEGAAPHPVNQLRQEIQEQCVATATRPLGIFTLTVPTGGGKTLSSLLWAMRHALHHGLKRIVIVIPYTSIIVQTAQVLRGIFGEENVLEHHSNVDVERMKENPTLKLQMKLATENWDYPIIVTTNVQLFESIYSNKPSACRKLHNLAQSVWIIDEVQTLPFSYLQPIVSALSAYQRWYRVSVLLTTASQPVLTGKHRLSGGAHFEGFPEGTVQEIIPDSMRLHERLRRVELHFDETSSSYDELANRLLQHDRVLCIVNTRRVAHELYQRLSHAKEKVFHLSRMMCPKHVAATLQEIKLALKREGSVVRVIATQLVEAGVDVDFPVVYRQQAGLDSILQAAGRCNREGKLPISPTYVFKLRDSQLRGSMRSGNNARENLTGVTDWFAPDTVKRYFDMLFSYEQSCDQKNIIPLLKAPCQINFETAQQAFRLIEDNGIPLIVAYADSAQWVDELRRSGPNYELMKRLGQYTVSVYDQDFKKLVGAGLVEEVLEGIYIVPDRAQYDEQAGLLTESHWLEEIIMV